MNNSPNESNADCTDFHTESEHDNGEVSRDNNDENSSISDNEQEFDDEGSSPEGSEGSSSDGDGPNMEDKVENGLEEDPECISQLRAEVKQLSHCVRDLSKQLSKGITKIEEMAKIIRSLEKKRCRDDDGDERLSRLNNVIQHGPCLQQGVGYVQPNYYYNQQQPQMGMLQTQQPMLNYIIPQQPNQPIMFTTSVLPTCNGMFVR